MSARKILTPEQKVAILREHLIEKVPVSQVCDKHGVSIVNFYNWQKVFFENVAAAFERKPNSANVKRQQDADQVKIEVLDYVRKWSEKRSHRRTDPEVDRNLVVHVLQLIVPHKFELRLYRQILPVFEGLDFVEPAANDWNLWQKDFAVIKASSFCHGSFLDGVCAFCTG
ncbi:MAG: transposase [Planctomycetales bacterium]|nr:transposase [Planctomycetales bacterium]